MTAVKICGLCRPRDAAAAAAAGADYVGVILAPGTRRTQTLNAAAGIFAAAGTARRVGVFVDPDPKEVREAVDVLSLQVAQLHGSESRAMTEELSEVVSVWKAVRIREPADLARAVEGYPHAAAMLVDAFHPQHAGGTGLRFDWEALVHVRRTLPEGLPLVLAGGLTSENVAQAIQLLTPHVVDVSSGVEQTLGEKSLERMTSFMVAVRHAVKEKPNDGSR